MLSLVTATDGDGQPGGSGRRSVEQKLSRASDRLAEAVDRLDEGRPSGSVDGALESAAGTLGAVLNRLENDAMPELSETTAVELRNTVPEAIDHVEAARDADSV